MMYLMLIVIISAAAASGVIFQALLPRYVECLPSGSILHA